MVVIDSSEMLDVCGGFPNHDDGPMASLAASSLASRYRFWRGASDRRYTVSVATIDPMSPGSGLPDFDGFVLVPVVRLGAGCWPLAALSIERTLDRHAAIAVARAGGASEWHVHLLGETRGARAAIVADLQARHFCGRRALSA